MLASTLAIGFTLTLLEHSIGVGAPTPEHPHPLPAPQAILMATLIKGLLSHNLPWGLVLTGMGISAVMELCGISSLAFAVGAYLPLSSTTPIFVGGIVKWIVDKKNKAKEAESDIGPGALFSSGLIAGGAITGIIIAIMIGVNIGTGPDGKLMSLADKFNFGIGEKMGATGDLVSLGCFMLLGFILYKFATSKKELS